MLCYAIICHANRTLERYRAVLFFVFLDQGEALDMPVCLPVCLTVAEEKEVESEE